jgi:trk system potassium uptake protein TrkH
LRLRRSLRRAFSAPSGVDLRAALNLTGTLLKFLSLSAALPTVVAIIYGEPFWPFLAAGAIAAGAGFALEQATRGAGQAGIREGFLVVSLTWLLAAAFGALPYVFAGNDQLSSPIDAYFEAMSGFTTTGASVVTDLPAVDHSILLWRQFTQWIGGMGIIVLFLAVLPRLRVGGRQLFESELPGPEIEPLAASIRSTARRLWLLYIGLTAAEILALLIVGLSGADDRIGLFEAVAHAFSTLPTGGFGVEARSAEEYAAATQWVLIVFMVIAGANFALTYAALVRGRFRPMLRDEELRLYLLLLAGGSLILFLELVVEDLYANSGEAARHAIFQTVSIMTTTGFASTDFNEWSSLALVVLVALMLAGGSAGSTSGSVKVVRHLLIGRLLRRELEQTVHPELVAPIRLNGRVVDEKTLRAVFAFVLLYIGVFALGTLLLVIDASRTGLDVRVIDLIAAAATTLGNVGPAFGPAGPMGSFDPFSGFSKGVLIVLMWLGRLEIIPVAVLLTRAYWRA